MLTLEQYGVRLVRLNFGDLELVRYWRNHSDVAEFMEYRREISEEMQAKWFQAINNKYNYYFIIEFEGKKIGLINSKDYDPALGFGEGGIFIWDKNYINSFAAVFSTLCLLNFVFFTLKLCSLSRARILRTNDRAIHYNKMLGYKLLPGQEDVVNQLYELSLEDYSRVAKKLNEAATILSEGKGTLTYSGRVCEENLDEINRLLSAAQPK